MMRFHKLKSKKRKNRKVRDRLKNRKRRRKLLQKLLVRIFLAMSPRTLEKRSVKQISNSALP